MTKMYWFRRQDIVDGTITMEDLFSTTLHSKILTETIVNGTQNMYMCCQGA